MRVVFKGKGTRGASGHKPAGKNAWLGARPKAAAVAITMNKQWPIRCSAHEPCSSRIGSNRFWLAWAFIWCAMK